MQGGGKEMEGNACCKMGLGFGVGEGAGVKEDSGMEQRKGKEWTA